MMDGKVFVEGLGMKYVDSGKSGSFSFVIASESVDGKEVSVRLCLSGNAPESAEFLPNEIYTGREGVDFRQLWKHARVNGFPSMSKIRRLSNGQLVIAFQDYDRTTKEVMVIKDLVIPESMRLVVGTSLEGMIEIKRLLAREYGMKVEFSSEEKRLMEVSERRIKERKDEAARLKREADDRLRDEVLARGRKRVYDRRGFEFTAFPVSSDKEMYLLGSNTFCVRLSESGHPIELIKVIKNKGVQTKLEVISSEVSFQKASVESNLANAVAPTGRAIVEIGKDVSTIICYPAGSVDALISMGINGGSRIGIGKLSNDNHIAVFQFNKGEAKQVGSCKVLEFTEFQAVAKE